MLGLCGLFEFIGCRLFSIGLYDNNEAFLIFGFIAIAIGFWLGLVGIKNLIVEANVKSLEIFHGKDRVITKRPEPEYDPTVAR
ncbi:MAG: hypothetical protein LBJ73_04965 [Rickettsiales bacterium]|jgi:hypothetical protein|nr:hypothetical protein [Rickettsiales bacterium]